MKNPPETPNIKLFHEKAYNEFIKISEDKLGSQAYTLKDKRAIKCAIQAVRYTLKDIYNYYGFLALRYIINYGITEKSEIDESFNVQNKGEVMNWVDDDMQLDGD